MSFRVNNVNYSCAPMYNQNNNNNVMGYLCSSTTRNYENFGNGKYSVNPLNNPNFKTPNYNGPSNGERYNIDASRYWYLLSNPSTLTTSNRNETNSSLTFKVGPMAMVNKILDFLVSNQRCHDNRRGAYTGSASLVMMFQLYSDAAGKPYYVVNPTLAINSDGTITLSGDNAENVTYGYGNGGALWNEMKSKGGNWQIRVGAVDENQQYRQLNES